MSDVYVRDLGRDLMDCGKAALGWLVGSNLEWACEVDCVDVDWDSLERGLVVEALALVRKVL